MKKRSLFISLCLTLLPLVSTATPQPRPFTGQGVLIVRPFGPDSAGNIKLTLYREPGVGRIAERSMGEIPLLSSHIDLPAGEYPLAVMGKKGEWLLVAYDDAGREGWLKPARWWEYVKWEDFLKGRSLRLLPGLKRERYSLHGEPSESSPLITELSGEESLRVIEVREKWILAITVTGLTGWLSWRDGDGRLMISLDQKNDPQKH